MPHSEPSLSHSNVPDGVPQRAWSRWEFPPPFFSLKRPPSDLALGYTLSEFRVSNFTRIPAIIAAAIIVAIWLLMASAGVIYSFSDEVPVYEILLSLTPITLLAAATVYFTLAVSRALIRIGDQGIVFRTALRLYWMPYRDIASATLVKVSSEARDMPVDAGYDLLLTPFDPTQKPVTVKRLFGRSDNMLIQAVAQWERYHQQHRLPTQHTSEVPEGAMTLAIDNYGSDTKPADPVPTDR